MMSTQLKSGSNYTRLFFLLALGCLFISLGYASQATVWINNSSNISANREIDSVGFLLVAAGYQTITLSIYSVVNQLLLRLRFRDVALLLCSLQFIVIAEVLVWVNFEFIASNPSTLFGVLWQIMLPIGFFLLSISLVVCAIDYRTFGSDLD